jgi:hypothetical protein
MKPEKEPQIKKSFRKFDLGEILTKVSFPKLFFRRMHEHG